MTAASQFEREIHEQPSAIERLLLMGRPSAERIGAAVRGYAPRHVVIAARGSSDNAARYGQYLLGAHNHLSVGLATASLFTLYESPPELAGALVIGISQSGRSPDLVAVIEEARRQGALTLALVNDAASPLATAAEHLLPLEAGPELAVAASKSYTAQLVALAMLSAALEGSADRFRELDALPGQIAAALRLGDAATKEAAGFRHAPAFVVIGRGYGYATASEIALKLKETSYIMAEPYSSADFRHGPAALLDRGLPVLLVAPSGKSYDDVAALAELAAQRGAEIVAISDRAELLDRAKAALPLPAGVPEHLCPAVAVVPGQLFALSLAKARGLDPDRPRGLSKVTETR